MRANMTRVEQVAADEGLEYHLAEGISGNTSLAHELLHHAAEHGRQGELKERLLFAHFTEARSASTSTRWSPWRPRWVWTATRPAPR